MKLRIYSDTGGLLVDHDITGVKWMSAGNGFVNIDMIAAAIDESGDAANIAMYDDFGTQLCVGQLNPVLVDEEETITGFGKMRLVEGQQISIRPGGLNFALRMPQTVRERVY